MRSRTHLSQHAGMVLVALALVVAAACGGGDEDSSSSTTAPGGTNAEDDAGPPQPGGTLTVALNAETNNWNPYTGQWASSSYLVANAIYDPLFAIDEDGEAQPYLAESMEVNEDFTEWTLKLRPGIEFHNGEVLDAEAVKTNFEAGRVSGLTAVAYASVASVDVVDELTVSIKTKAPWSTLPLLLTTQPGYMAAPEMLASEDGARNPVGTGPFVFGRWVPDSSLEVSRNEDFWRDGVPYLDGIEFRVLTDTEARTQALLSGNVDAIQAVVPSQVIEFGELAAEGEYQLFTDAEGEGDEIIIALNTEVPPFDNPTARLAIATGIDQDVLSETSFQGAFPGARTPFREESPFYVPPEDLGYPTYDPDKARELVEQYEEESGEAFSFSALVPPDPTYQAIAQALQAQAEEAGMDVQLEGIEQTQLITRVLGGDYQAAGFVLFSSPTFDRAYPFIATPAIPAPGLSLNFTRNDNPRIKAAMDEARATDDPDAQVEAYRTVQEEMAKDLDRVFLVHSIGGIAYADNVHGFLASTFPDSETPAIPGYGLSAPFTYAVWMQD